LNQIVKQCISENNNIEPLRKCKTCGIEAHTKDELSLYVKEKSCKHGRVPLCYSCNRKRAAKWEEENREKSIKGKLDSRARRTYKITYEEYEKRMATSDCCEICGSKKKLGYDHCHKTMEFRGVLCNKCNRSIGQLGDTLESVQKAVTYLSKGL
jgi:hypothetical protein